MDNIADHLLDGELDKLEVLRWLARCEEIAAQPGFIDIDNDTKRKKRAAERVARTVLHEVFKGSLPKQPKIASFPNGQKTDEILHPLGPISIRRCLMFPTT